MFTICYYRKPSGECPVDSYLASLDKPLRVKTMRSIMKLERYGNLLREPDTKPLAKGVFELRTAADGCAGRVLFFFFKDNRIILTHGFLKKTRKTPKREIERALTCKAAYEKEGRNHE